MFWKQADYWSYIRKDYESISQPYREDDINDTFKFLRKFCVMVQLFNKYRKVNLYSLDVWRHTSVIMLNAGIAQVSQSAA